MRATVTVALVMKALPGIALPLQLWGEWGWRKSAPG
jgi:hypothetical protein